MKKRLFILMFVMMAVCSTIMAVPAHPKPVKVQQPDGSYVTIQLRGDEWLSFNTTVDGYSVVKNEQGYYVYAALEQGQLKATRQVAHDVADRQTAECQFLTSIRKHQVPAMSAEKAHMKQLVEQSEAEKRSARRSNGRRAAQYDYSNFKGLVILVGFNDKSFSRRDFKDLMNDMLNKENYTGFDNQVYTGSVRDYFSDNSLGKFQPQFDVAGPYQVNYSCKVGNTKTYEILNAAVNAADADINFKDYDGDNDGVVDMIFFLVAGNGRNYVGNDDGLWHPHRSVLTNGYNYVVKDGVRLWDYASSTELQGYTAIPSTVKIDGIGTICHEFSHVLGLPDFYDADYEVNGQSNDPGTWSVMAGGSYENDARTPVGYSLYERWFVGFTDEDPEVIEEGNYSLEALHLNMKGYRINTPTNGEYFLMENRQKNAFKWDQYLPGSGLLVHRVEGEGNWYWNYNDVNAYADHNYYEVVRANGAHKQDGVYVSSYLDAFPSNGKISLTNTTSPANLKTWAGKDNALAIRNIQMSNGVITFTAGGYEVESLTVTPDVIDGLGVGLSQQLTVTLFPESAQTTLTWTSDHPEIASVDQNGMVTGVAEGSCTITVTSANNKKATCQVTVIEVPSYSIAEFKQQEIGSVVKLQLTDAEVLGVYQQTAYVRDATGCITLAGMDLGLKRNDKVSGSLMAQVANVNKMWQADGTEFTNAGGLTIVAGSEPIPREVILTELTEADYGDYVLVKAAKLKQDGGAWAVTEEDNKLARLWNKLQISGITIKNYNGNYYDIPAIYGTDVLNGTIINEMYMLKSPVKVEKPSGITTLYASPCMKQHEAYNLQGQRVDAGYKGLVIRNGKKMVVK